MAAIDTGNMKDDETPSVKKQKGSNGYPKGVSETGRKTIRFQARVGYKPSPDGKTVQRSAGTFDTPEEAALQVAAYEAKLAEGIDPWNGEQVRSQHGRGQVRSQFRRRVSFGDWRALHGVVWSLRMCGVPQNPMYG